MNPPAPVTRTVYPWESPRIVAPFRGTILRSSHGLGYTDSEAGRTWRAAMSMSVGPVGDPEGKGRADPRVGRHSSQKSPSNRTRSSIDNVSTPTLAACATTTETSRLLVACAHARLIQRSEPPESAKSPSKRRRSGTPEKWQTHATDRRRSAVSKGSPCLNPRLGRSLRFINERMPSLADWLLTFVYSQRPRRRCYIYLLVVLKHVEVTNNHRNLTSLIVRNPVA